MSKARFLLFLAAASAWLLASAPTSAVADSLIVDHPVGSVVTGVLTLPHVDVPMPAGPWTVIGGEDFSDGNNHNHGTLYLAQILSGQFTGYAVISSNADLRRNGWGHQRECRRSDLLFVEPTHDESLTEGCWWVTHVFMPHDSDTADKLKIFDYASQQGTHVPTTLVELGVRFGDDSSYLMAKWRFNPELEGIAPTRGQSWATNEFHRTQIALYPDHQRYFEKIKAFGETWIPLARQGFGENLYQSQLNPAPDAELISALLTTGHLPAPPAGPRSTIDERLATLKSLLDKGLINQADYEKKRREILSKI